MNQTQRKLGTLPYTPFSGGVATEISGSRDEEINFLLLYNIII